ncbi:acid phosphatase [Sphingomonas kyeonggiensis]|uniref:Acid phosphatase n=1 Tax=Sphingomonas kyeonggiensis TaxID=1268553 RepID=A0A7W6JSC8_9SPHN|nr:phosphatase PAP2 family protein [Sphingomonas kyeonggiensis]MBB4098653.1 acid phosphatase (class A) [Sphingomonas kyeonggiensis]
MSTPRSALMLAAWLALTAMGQAQDSGPYLPPDRVPDGLAILPPPPTPGSPAARADRAIFEATRKLEGTPRWRIATEDVTNDPLDRFACALGMKLDAKRAPALARLLDRAGTGPLVNPVKAHYRAPRPYLGTNAPICEPKTRHLAENGDYPSGHAANGWLEGLILAELVPDRATAILARARAYGESRAVCGSHSVSAVQAGWMSGTAMFAVLGATPGFQRDLQAARSELEAIGSGAPRPDQAQCAADQAALATRPW